MAQETLILDGSNPAAEKEFQQDKVQKEKFQEELINVVHHEKNKYQNIKGAVGVLAGAGAVLAMMSFTPAPAGMAEEIAENPIPLPEDPERATSVDDKMSFSDAFASAREEEGAGGYFIWHGNSYSTYYQEEWNKLTPEEQSEFYHNIDDHGTGVSNHSHDIIEVTPEAVVIYDVAPVSIFASDDMSFQDAFAVARDEVGPGGVFEWGGQTFSTYTKAEWRQMDKVDQMDYQHSVDHANISSDDLLYNHDGILASDIVHTDVTNPIETDINSGNEVFLGEQLVDLGNGQQATVGLFEVNGVQEIRIDADNNGTFEYKYDPETESVSNLQTGETIAANNDEVADSSSPIATEETMIDGHTAWVSTFADGSIEANVDFDDDGIPDSLVQIDQTGHMQLLNSNGDLIHEEQLNNYDDASMATTDDLDPHSTGGGSLALNDHEIKEGQNFDDNMNHDGNHDVNHDVNSDVNHNVDSDDHFANNDFDNNFDNDYNSHDDMGFDNHSSMDDWG